MKLNVIITLITIIPKYYFNQHYNKADNKYSKQNERERQRTFCLELIRYVYADLTKNEIKSSQLYC